MCKWNILGTRIEASFLLSRNGVWHHGGSVRPERNGGGGAEEQPRAPARRLRSLLASVWSSGRCRGVWRVTVPAFHGGSTMAAWRCSGSEGAEEEKCSSRGGALRLRAARGGGWGWWKWLVGMVAKMVGEAMGWRAGHTRFYIFPKLSKLAQTWKLKIDALSSCKNSQYFYAARLSYYEQCSQLCQHQTLNKIRVKNPGTDSTFESLMNFKRHLNLLEKSDKFSKIPSWLDLHKS
jgi:hypothetical protein